MKIAILTSGILPVPAVQGGAVENLIDFYLEYNQQHRLHDITIYSVWHPDVKKHPALQSKVNHYRYINTSSFIAKARRKVYGLLHQHEYYNSFIEYFFEQALKDIKKEHYDCIILENRPGYALKLKEQTTAKMMFHLHNDLLNNNCKSATEIYDAASRIITVSDYITHQVHTINPNDSKCITVYNGINISAFSDDISPALLDTLYNDDFVIVFSGRINREKGIMELIAAMNIIGNGYPIKLLVLGSSFYGNADNDNAFAKQLQEMANPIKDRITFTGYIPYSTVPCYLKRADIAVLPSTWNEPFGLTVAEAQASGLPIITTRQGGIPEVVTEENAILLEADEHLTDNLANAIIDLYEHPEKRKQMGLASLKRARLFDKETYAHNFLNALGTFCEG